MAVKKKTAKKKVAKKKSVTKKTNKLDEYGLTAKEREVADLYRAGPDDVKGNAKLCYKKVFTRCKLSTAETEGPKLLRKSQVEAYLKLKADEATEKADITEERVMAELAKMGFSNMGDYVDWSNGAIAIKASSGLTVDQMAAVSEISETVTQFGGTIKFKLHDKKGALELMGRKLKMFTDKVEHEHNHTFKQILDDMDGQDTGLPSGNSKN